MFPPNRLHPISNTSGLPLNTTSKPVAMMRYLVQKFTSPGDMVLDLLAGLGPASEACFLDERSVIAVERDWEQMVFIHRRLTGDTTNIINAAMALDTPEYPIKRASDSSIGWSRHTFGWDVDNKIMLFPGPADPSKILPLGTQTVDPGIDVAIRDQMPNDQSEADDQPMNTDVD